jgi:monoamine oxidase
MDVVEELCHSIDIHNPQGHDDLTLEEFVLKRNLDKNVMSIVSLWTRAMLGMEPSEMSALYFLDYCKSGGGLKQMRSDRKHGGQYLRCKTGKPEFLCEYPY